MGGEYSCGKDIWNFTECFGPVLQFTCIPFLSISKAFLSADKEESSAKFESFK